MAEDMQWPVRVTSETGLEELLSRPSPELIALMGRLQGDLMILGIGGKMGASLGQLAQRAGAAAGVARRIIGVSRFSDPAVEQHLTRLGLETITCDLLDPEAVARLPRVPNVIFMAGRKFGTEGRPELTWAMNTLPPAHVAAHFAGSRIVAFSTACVYPLVAVTGAGCSEDTPPAPVGEYAQSCLGRERMFEYFSRQHGTQVCLIRLSYAQDLRYGVLWDIATRVWQGTPVSLEVPCFNGIWQGDANAQVLLALEHCASPPFILNITGPEILWVREMAEACGRLLEKPVTFQGAPGPRAYLVDASRALTLFGPPRIDVPTMLRWVTDWVQSGGRALNQPTHYEVATGEF